MKRSLFFRLAAILLALVLTSLGSGALALGSDPGQAESLADGIPRSGALAGSSGGAYAYYALSYPGNGASVTVETMFTPADPAILRGVGMIVYGNSGAKLGQGAPNERGYTFTRTDSSPATWLVQVYNYLPGTTVSFSIAATGLGEAVAGRRTRPGQGGAAAAQAGPAPATLPQSGSANSIYESIIRDGRFTDLAVALILADMADGLRGAGDYTLFAPTDAAFARLPGDSWSTVQRDRAALQHVMSHHLVPRRLTRAEIARGGTVKTAAGDSLALSSVRIAGGPINARNGVIYAVSAVLMPGPKGTQLAAGRLVGSSGGAYAMVPLPYSANGASLTVRMQFGPDNPSISRGVGLIVYGPTGESWRGKQTGTPGEREITFLGTAPGSYQIQVYNYIAGLTLSYALSTE